MQAAVWGSLSQSRRSASTSFQSAGVIAKRGEVGISAVEKPGTTVSLHGLVQNHLHRLFFFAS
jgi:hypothetical protein